MALFANQGQAAGAPGAANHAGKVDVNGQVRSMRMQGLTDDQILGDLKGQGVKENQIISALGAINHEAPMDPSMGGMPADMGAHPAAMPADNFRLPTPPAGQAPQGMPMHPSAQGAGGSEDLYGRIEEITEEMIDEKWSDLIKEVQKIIEWKNKSEARIAKLETSHAKLKEDFKTLHQGVLGKVEEYDKRMQEVGTELHAVGKVFKDVIPVFTENVKELKSTVQGMKK